MRRGIRGQWPFGLLRAALSAIALFAVLSAGACAGDDDDDDTGDAADIASDDDTGNNGSVHIDPTPQGWSIQFTRTGGVELRYDGRSLFTLTGVSTRTFTPTDYRLFGIFKRGQDGPVTRLLDLMLDGDRVVLTEGSRLVGTLTAGVTGAGALRVGVHVEEGPADSIVLRFSLSPTDRFWGFGEQYSFIDLRGLMVPIVVQEQGLGRRAKPLLPFEGGLVNSYFPMPYFLDPQKGKGFLLENDEYSLFNLGASTPEAWSVEVWNGSDASFLVFPGPTGMDVTRDLTAEVGRAQRRPPDWAFSGAWIAAQGGSGAVRERVDRVRSAGAPVTAAWVQDWVGLRDFGLGNYGVKYRWFQDVGLYPDLDSLIDELGAEGVRFLGYFNPFIVPAYQQWDDAVSNGYTIHHEDGSPYTFLISTFNGSLVDVTNPDAVEYFQNFAWDAVALGMKGWMADFGEWLPYDAVLDNGAAATEHNRYPTRWHRANREVLDAAYPDGDYVLFTRSGFTGEQSVAQVLWAGDQETDWSTTDGLPTVVTAGLTAGMSGIPFFTHDIGGFSGGPRTKELLLRWIELGAFTPFMRTHDGLQKTENAQIDSDEETLDFFARFARIHQALTPYWLKLADEAVATGLPMIRHTAMVDPDWGDAYRAGRQWMLGADLIVVPVTTKGDRWVTVFLPKGSWENLFTGRVVEGRDIIWEEAPIGTPAVFVRQGSMDAIVDTIRGIAGAP